jgi:hypothetical protein
MCIPKDTDRDQDSDYEDPSEELDEEDDEHEEENICIRAKWSIDNASTIDEAVEKLNRFIEYLTSLKNEGWEFREPIQDDYGFLYKKEP